MAGEWLDRLGLSQPNRRLAGSTVAAPTRQLGGSTAGARQLATGSGYGRQLASGSSAGTGRRLGSYGSTYGYGEGGRRLTDPTANQPPEWMKLAQQQMPGYGGAAGGGSVGVGGGQWAALDALNPAIQRAGQELGVPPNLIKSMLAREGAFGTHKQVVPLRGEAVYAFNGIFQSTAASRGIDFWRMTQDDGYAVWAMGKVLADIYYQDLGGQGTWDDAAAYYFAGPQNYRNMGWGDETGENTVQNYLYGPTGVVTRWQGLDSLSGGQASAAGWPGGPDVPGVTGQGSRVLQEALTFVGRVPYVLGAIPGRGETPAAWDCSGFTYWLDQNYGRGTMPMGSHEQYAWAASTGNLTTDPNALTPGDIVFFDTGASYRGNAASHVAVYLGNGKILHAANPSLGTIVSDFNSYLGMYPFLGGARMAWSGGAAAVPTTPGGTTYGSTYGAPAAPTLGMGGVLGYLNAGGTAVAR